MGPPDYGVGPPANLVALLRAATWVSTVIGWGAKVMWMAMLPTGAVCLLPPVCP